MNDGIIKEESWAKLERADRIANLNPENTLKLLGLKTGDRFVDFGSGTGVFVRPALIIVGELGRVFAVERSQLLIDKMQTSLPTQVNTLRIVHQDLMELMWDFEQVDYALMSHVAHELPDLGYFLSEAKNAVVPGGKMGIIEWCAKEQTQGPPLEKRISEERMNGLLIEAGWVPGESTLLGDNFYMVTAIKPI